MCRQVHIGWIKARGMSTSTDASSTAGGLLHKIVAEAIGTFALVFVGCGAIVVNDLTAGSLGHVGVSAAFGLVIMTMIYATGHISGAHFNPAVTVAFALVGRLPWREVPAYIVGQLGAAIAGSGLLAIMLGLESGAGVTEPHMGLPAAILMEITLTFVLMFVITAVATDSRAEGAMAGLAIGATVAMAALFGGPVSGASMNPARSLGPAIVSGHLESIVIYILCPLAGASLGALVYVWLQRCQGRGGPGAGCC